MVKCSQEEALVLHRSATVLDAHCDTLTVLGPQERSLSERSAKGHLDLPRLALGGVRVQFFAAFIAPEFKHAPVARALELIDRFYRELEQNAHLLHLVERAADIETALAAGKIAALLAVEGGEALGGELFVLRTLYRLGVRSLTLTWNGRNELADGVGEAAGGGGLTRFGKSVVREMNALGMLVDVSHLAERGFWDVLETSAHPVIASHSNCRALLDHPRNLNDRQLKALAEKGGVAGITFVPEFLAGEGASLEHVLDHIDHAVRVGGVESVGLGSDFDGVDSLPAGLDDCSLYPAITRGLVARGYGGREVEMILGGNFLRVIRQVLR
ncbi:MAG: dipeptidase [Firmicutes bacterium]|nr:dipeptidase [Bacillota bacterium]